MTQKFPINVELNTIGELYKALRSRTLHISGEGSGRIALIRTGEKC